MALWSPADIATALWLDAADSSTLFDAVSGGSLVATDGRVARINDKSGNARNFIQGTFLNRPVRKNATYNTLDVLRFDGLDDRLDSAPIAAFNTQNLFWVVICRTLLVDTTSQIVFHNNHNAGINGNQLWSVTYSAIGDVFASGRTAAGALVSARDIGGYSTSLMMMTGSWTANTVRGWRDGNRLEDGTGANQTPASHSFSRLGASGATANFFHGDVGELIVCTPVPDENIIDRIHGYLAWKWGLESLLPSEHPYEDSAPTTGTIQTRRRRELSGGGL